MSIIEKAVKALGKGKIVERQESGIASVDSQTPTADSVNTVQRAEGSAVAQDQSTTTDFQEQQSSPEGTSLAQPVSGKTVKIPFKELRELRQQ